VRQEDELFGCPDYALACKISGGVIREPTAGRSHGLTDDIPWAVHVLVPAGKRIKPYTPYTAGVVIAARRTRQSRNQEIGVERMSFDGFHIRVTDKARTVVDLLRWGGVRQHAVEAVRSYLADGRDTGRLHAMAWEFGVGREIGIMTAAMLVAFERMPVRVELRP
jgi:predicted transcriptional regulator of viral defense system